MCWSPDSQKLAVSFDLECLTLFHVNALQLSPLIQKNFGVHVAWSPDGRLLASTCSDEAFTIKIWDPLTGELQQRLFGHIDYVNSLEWASNGSRLLSASDDGTVVVWDTTTWKSIRSFESDKQITSTATFSPDGVTMASGGTDRVIRIWDSRTGMLVHELAGHGGDIARISYSRDGGTLASIDSDGVRVWDPVFGTQLAFQASDIDAFPTHGLEFHPLLNRLAYVDGNDRTIRVVDVNRSSGPVTPLTSSQTAPATPQVHLSDKILELIAAFERLLDSCPREELIQEFLTKHTVLLAPTANRVLTKIPLGSEYVTDFVIEDPGERYTLVEIERPDLSVFTRAGNPSSSLTHAQRQVEDWRQWVHDNVGYARNTLPNINEPRALVVIGRRGTIGESGRKLLARKNAEHPNIQIITYDDLMDLARAHAINLRRI
ncbi:MAG: hypothetical protein K0R39_1663 [Symbiobacteriaceae bacterium]|jgi:dipeptidyl aminopeptidase/acylaminoacyl peptidase|nr:hypothetical protein [Symbiobacteriaceae bacterium]